MEPVGEVEQQLLNKSTKGVMRSHHPGTQSESFGLSKQQWDIEIIISMVIFQLDKFSCGHVIPAENLLPLTMSHGVKMELNFSFEGR